MSSRNTRYLSLSAAVLFALAQLACGSSNDRSADTGDTGGSGGSSASGSSGDAGGSGGASGGATGSTGGFESPDPTNVAMQPPGTSASTGSGTSTTGGVSPGGSGGTGGDDAARLIEEADIVKVVDDRLYAMSSYTGVAVIDVSDLDELSLLGLYRAHGTPFEMYVKDGIVFALYQDYGEYVRDEADGSETFVQTSHVLVLDASDPASLTELQSFSIPGNISDSRLVGDILYVTAFEDGYCYMCEDLPRTTLVSLDVSDPAQVEKIDELSFDDVIDLLGWKRTVMFTDERAYIAGPTWEAQSPTGSTLRVVDVSDPSGALVEGAALQVAGQVNSRWQMDEYDGVLRVISQPFDSDLSVPPSVETFSVNSADDITPLGSLALTLPRPERLQSVRFDADRGYAITFERTDPLFTIDLSDPETPVQAGTLEMPGWLYHMEPRGDRLVGLGYDEGNAEGAVAVSLFDVSDLKAPTLLSRANFGSDGAWLTEDQDRIHKAFQLFDEAGLIAMPFSGSVSQADSGKCYTTWINGVQLIDWQNDELTARGVAEMGAPARRGFLLDDRLVTVGDEQVAAFDISDRDAPDLTSDVALTQFVYRTVASGDRVLRIGPGQTYVESEVDIADLDEVSLPHSTASLSLGYDPDEVCNGDVYMPAALPTADRAYLIFDGYKRSLPSGLLPFHVDTLDLSGDGVPKLLGSVDLDLDLSTAYDTFDRTPPSPQGVVRVGDTLIFNHQVFQYENDIQSLGESGVYVLNLADPSDAEARYFELPKGRLATGLVTDGTLVGRSHYVTSETNPANVRYFLDRVDLSDPDDPQVLPSLNAPGSLLAIAGDRALLLDFKRVVTENASADECWANIRVVSFDTDGATQSMGTCTALTQVLTLIRVNDGAIEVLGTEELKPTEEVAYFAQGNGVAFAITANGSYSGYPEISCLTCAYAHRAPTLLTVGGLAGGDFTVGRIDRDWDDTGIIVAKGHRAVVAGGFHSPVTLIDASDPANPEIVKEALPHGLVSDLAIVGTMAVVGLGPGGVETIRFEE